MGRRSASFSSRIFSLYMPFFSIGNLNRSEDIQDPHDALEESHQYIRPPHVSYLLDDEVPCLIWCWCITYICISIFAPISFLKRKFLAEFGMSTRSIRQLSVTYWCQKNLLLKKIIKRHMHPATQFTLSCRQDYLPHSRN